MRTRTTVIGLVLAGAIPCSGSGGVSEFSYCNMPLDLPENPLAVEMTPSQLPVVIRCS